MLGTSNCVCYMVQEAYAVVLRCMCTVGWTHRVHRRQAATMIQSMWRAQLARQQLEVAKAAAVKVQACWRGYQARQRYADSIDCRSNVIAA